MLTKHANDSHLRADIGRKVKALREAAGLSLRRVGVGIARSHVAVHKVEQGHGAGSLETMLALCSYFDVTPNFLFGWEC